MVDQSIPLSGIDADGADAAQLGMEDCDGETEGSVHFMRSVFEDRGKLENNQSSRIN